MQEHNTYITHKTRQTQTLHLVILKGLQNPRPILGKPRHNSTGLTKPRANTSSVQGSTNPRFTLVEPFLLPSSVSTRTQGLPLTIFSIPNFYMCRNTSLLKPKARPWYVRLKNPRSTLGLYIYKTQGIPLVRSLASTTTNTLKGLSLTK